MEGPTLSITEIGPFVPGCRGPMASRGRWDRLCSIRGAFCSCPLDLKAELAKLRPALPAARVAFVLRTGQHEAERPGIESALAVLPEDELSPAHVA